MANEQRMRPRKRKKVCAFCVDKMTSIDYKDTAKIRRYLSGSAYNSGFSYGSAPAPAYGTYSAPAAPSYGSYAAPAAAPASDFAMLDDDDAQLPF